jgi:hypothetical protein
LWFCGIAPGGTRAAVVGPFIDFVIAPTMKRRIVHTIHPQKIDAPITVTAKNIRMVSTIASIDYLTPS